MAGGWQLGRGRDRDPLGNGPDVDRERQSGTRHLRRKCLHSISRNTTITLGLALVLLTFTITATWAMAGWTNRQTTRYERMAKDLAAIKKALNEAGILPEWQSNAAQGETDARSARDALGGS